jgi:hypothetical protein
MQRGICVGLKKRRRARSSRLLCVSPYGESPASLTEGGLPGVCWPEYETRQRRKKFQGLRKK